MKIYSYVVKNKYQRRYSDYTEHVSFRYTGVIPENLMSKYARYGYFENEKSYFWTNNMAFFKIRILKG